MCTTRHAHHNVFHVVNNNNGSSRIMLYNNIIRKEGSMAKVRYVQ